MAEHLAAKGIDVLGTYHSNREEAETVAEQLRAADATAHFEAFDAAASETYEGFAARGRIRTDGVCSSSYYPYIT